MKTNDYVRIVIYVIITALFNLIFFMMGGAKVDSTGWVAYGFAHLAFLISCGAPFLCIHYKRVPENLVTIYVFAWIYSGIAFVFNLITLILSIKSMKIVLMVNVILFAIYLIQLLINMNVNYAVEKNIETVDAERQFVRENASKLKMVMQLCNTDEARRSVEKAYDAVRSCPLHSNDQAMNYEIEIMRLADSLEKKIIAGDYQEIDVISRSIVVNCQKRNSVL